jgi:hypothetical protein
MVFSLIALHDRDNGLCHQHDELLFLFGFYYWTPIGILVVVEVECGLLHDFAPAGSASSP